MWDIPDDFRKDLKELVTLLTSNSDLQWIYDYIDNYEIEEDEEEQEYLSNYPIDPEIVTVNKNWRRS